MFILKLLFSIALLFPLSQKYYTNSGQRMIMQICVTGIDFVSFSIFFFWILELFWQCGIFVVLLWGFLTLNLIFQKHYLHTSNQCNRLAPILWTARCGLLLQWSSIVNINNKFVNYNRKRSYLISYTRRVSRITFMRYTHNQKNGELNNIKVLRLNLGKHLIHTSSCLFCVMC